MKEAANTVGIVARIHAIEVKSCRTTLIIELALGHIAASRTIPDIGRPTLGPLGVGGSYVVPEALNQDDVFGFVVLRPPIRLLASNNSWNDAEDPARLAVELPATESSSGIGSFGHAACSICNGKIPYGRIAAIPTTRICTKCKKNQEIAQYERTVERRRK